MISSLVRGACRGIKIVRLPDIRREVRLTPKDGGAVLVSSVSDGRLFSRHRRRLVLVFLLVHAARGPRLLHRRGVAVAVALCRRGSEGRGGG